MPLRWNGTVETRHETLDKQGRRCDGNNRRCVRSAVQMIWVLRASETGNPFATPEVKQTCNSHRRTFESGGMWKLIRTQRMPDKYTPQELREIPQWWRKTEYVSAEDAARHAEEPATTDRTDDVA